MTRAGLFGARWAMPTGEAPGGTGATRHGGPGGGLRLTTEDKGRPADADATDDPLTTYRHDGLNRRYHVVVRRGTGHKLFEQTYGLRADGQRESVVEAAVTPRPARWRSPGRTTRPAG